MANVESPEDLLRLSNKAYEVLDIIKEVFATNGVALPTREYITIGDTRDTAHDADQLTIALQRIYPGTPGTGSLSIVERNCLPGQLTAVFQIELVRCIPAATTVGRSNIPKIPTAEEIDSMGKTQMIDYWLLYRAAQDMSKDDPFLGRTKTVFDIESGGPKGNFQAIQMQVDISV